MQPENLLTETCYICESKRIHYRFISNGYPICQCEDCDFMFKNPQPSNDVLSKGLMNDDTRKDIFKSNKLNNNEVTKIMAKTHLDRITAYFGRTSGKILKIGFDNIDFSVMATERGFDVTNLVLSEHTGIEADNTLRNETQFYDVIEKVVKELGQFDICVLFGVIERVRKPLEFMNWIYSVLKLNGVLYIVTPSLSRWSAKSMNEHLKELSADNLHYFDTQTIQNVLNKAGFQDIFISPNYKYLSIENAKKNYEERKPHVFSKLLAASSTFLPGRLKGKHFQTGASGINVLSRKNQLHKKPTVSIIVPVYNEAATFPELMNTLQIKDIPGLNKEIIIVESNSTDGTREEVLKFEDAPGIKIVFEERPQGKGHAVRTGLQYATGDFLMIQDGDLEYDLNDYDQLLEPLIKYQKAFVLGSRHSNGWKMRHFADQPSISFVMNFGQAFFATLLNIFCGSKLKDPFTMYKVFRRDCLYGLIFKANRFDFDWELVIKFLRKGYAPLEIPVNYNSRSFKQGKKVSFIKDPILWIWALLRFRFGPLYQKRRG